MVNNYDILVDCTDNLAARQLINQHAVREGKAFVSASALSGRGVNGFDFGLTPGSVSTVLLTAIPEPRPTALTPV